MISNIMGKRLHSSISTDVQIYIFGMSDRGRIEIRVILSELQLKSKCSSSVIFIDEEFLNPDERIRFAIAD